MEKLQRRNVDFWKLSAARTAILAVPIIFGFSSAVWSQPLDVGGKRGIDVATVNLYIGASFTPVTTLNSSDPDFGAKLLAGVATIYGNLVATRQTPPPLTLRSAPRLHCGSPTTPVCRQV
jgi:hypothetical protein